MKIITNLNEDVGNGWQRPVLTLSLMAFRSGWRGAWDAIKCAWRKDDRLQLETTLTMSLYAKPTDDNDPDITYTWGAQLETEKVE